MISIPLIITGVIFVEYLNNYYLKKVVWLDTNQMKQADISSADSINGLAVVSVYYCHQTQSANDTIPWADVFVCINRHPIARSKTDTILLLDTALKKVSEPNNPGIYSAVLRKARRLPKCKILIPNKEARMLKGSRYKYVGVTLVTDD